MKIFFLIAAAVLAALYSIACQQNSPANTSAEMEQAPKPELFLYAVLVNDLNLRKAPSKSAEVLAQLKAGEIVEGEGVVSSNVEEHTLRGVNYREPYIQVVAAREAVTSGWAYGGALLCLYNGPKSGSPDRERLSALVRYLNSLDVKDMNSGSKAWEYLDTNLADAQGALADAAFFLIERHLRRMWAEGEFYQIVEKIPFSPEDIKAMLDNNFNAGKFPATAALVASGFKIVAADGTFFPVVDWQRLQNYFGPRSSPAVQKFINQRTAEQKVEIYDDGAIIIPIYLLADLAAFWEKFNLSYPYFPLSAECRESERANYFAVLTGSDNTPIYDPETKKIKDDFVLAWRYVLREFPDTKLGRKVQEMSDLCESEAWIFTPKVETFVNTIQQQKGL